MWRAPGGAGLVVAAKGAPEAIGVLCRLDAARGDALMAAAEAMASEGLRVLGVARAAWPDRQCSSSQRDFAFELLGLVGLSDPLRADIPDAVRACRQAGVRVLMVTGGYPATARAMARQAGLDGGDVLAGDELEAMSARTLAARLAGAPAPARASRRPRSCASCRRSRRAAPSSP